MESVIFDTNILIDFLNREVRAALEFQRYGNQCAISSITWMEVLVGAKSADDERKCRALLTQFEIVEIDASVREEAVRVRKEYRLKLPDAIIFASARVNRRKLVTRNIKDFPADWPEIIVPYRLHDDSLH